MSRKLVFVVTHGPEDPERAIIPFAMAVAAQAAGIEVVMGFQVEGSWLLKKGSADDVMAPKLTPLKELMGIYRSNGGKYYVCGACVDSRGIKATDLVEEASVVNAPFFAEQFITATNVLVY